MQGWEIALIVIAVLILIGFLIYVIVMVVKYDTLFVTQNNVAAGVQLSWKESISALHYTYNLRNDTTNTVVIPSTATDAQAVLIPSALLVVGNKYIFSVARQNTDGSSVWAFKSFVYGSA